MLLGGEMTFVMVAKYNVKGNRSAFVKKWHKVLGTRFKKNPGLKVVKVLTSRKNKNELMILTEWRNNQDFRRALNEEAQQAMAKAGLTKSLTYHEAFDHR